MTALPHKSASMDSQHLLSDEELDEYLREDPDEFVGAVYHSRKMQIMRYLKSVTRGILSADELADVFQETMLSLIRLCKKAVDPKNSMRLVWDVAKKRAIDGRRKKLKLSSRVLSNQEVLEANALADLDGASFGIRWKYADPAEKAELDACLIDVISSLPERQRIISQLFFEMYEELRERDKYRPLADALSRITGKHEDVVTVKSSLQAAMGRIRSELRRRGFKLITEHTR